MIPKLWRMFNQVQNFLSNQTDGLIGKQSRTNVGAIYILVAVKKQLFFYKKYNFWFQRNECNETKDAGVEKN